MESISDTRNFVVVRTPRLSLRFLESLLKPDSDIDLLIAQWLECDQVKESLYVASPSLHSRIDVWLKEPNAKDRDNVCFALIKYFIRMTSRPTPFGLFSGVCLGKVADSTILQCASDGLFTRKTRFDMFMLGQLKAAVAKRAVSELCYHANPTIYHCGDTVRYIESYDSDDAQHYRLASVERTTVLDFVLSVCKQALPFEEVKAILHSQYEGFSSSEIDLFVKQLIDESLIVAHLPLFLTASSPDKVVLEIPQLFDEKEVLERGLSQLESIDEKRCASIEDYKRVCATLSDLPIKIQENKLFQVDIFSGLDKCELNANVVNTTRQAIELISRASATTKNPFSQFIEQFDKRFDSQLVALSVVLDDESGIGFSEDTGYGSNLLSGLNLRTSKAHHKNYSLTPMQKLILQKMSLPQYKNADILKLSTEELKQLTTDTQEMARLPYSYAAVVSLFEENKKDIIKLISVYGPSAANLLGRFCHLDEELRESVKRHLKKEELHSDDVIFAEVVHMPDGRPGNVVARPRLRNYEIVFLADSDIDDKYLISINDLYVWVEEDRVKLWSKKLKKQVIPRMSNAHNFSNHSLSAYRFLCSLQYQSYSLPANIAPEVFSEYSVTPRIMLDNIVLHEKTWRIPYLELANVLVDNKFCSARYRVLKQKYRLNDLVTFTVADNTLTLNLANPVLFSLLVKESKEFSEVVVKESLMSQYASVAKSADGEEYANEIIIPFENTNATPYRTLRPQQLERTIDCNAVRSYSPGSKWMSIKIYSGNSQAEDVFTKALAPLISSLSSFYKKWFFIRFNDPEWHLRLRFLGEPEVLYGKLLPSINQCLQPFIDSNTIGRVELFTYQRELERYGGEQLLECSETLFMLESELVAELLPLIHAYGENVRWRAAAYCIDRVMSHFGYSVTEKLALTSVLRDAFGREFNEGVELRKQLGKKYKNIKSVLINDFNAALQPEKYQITQETHEFLDCIRNWSDKYKNGASNAINALSLSKMEKDELLTSLLHMLNNRLFNAYTREHEFVMYDFLRRYYLYLAKTQ